MRDGSTAVRGDWVGSQSLFLIIFLKTTGWLDKAVKRKFFYSIIRKRRYTVSIKRNKSVTWRKWLIFFHVSFSFQPWPF